MISRRIVWVVTCAIAAQGAIQPVVLAEPKLPPRTTVAPHIEMSQVATGFVFSIPTLSIPRTGVSVPLSVPALAKAELAVGSSRIGKPVRVTIYDLSGAVVDRPDLDCSDLEHAPEIAFRVKHNACWTRTDLPVVADHRTDYLLVIEPTVALPGPVSVYLRAGEGTCGGPDVRDGDWVQPCHEALRSGLRHLRGDLDLLFDRIGGSPSEVLRLTVRGDCTDTDEGPICNQVLEVSDGGGDDDPGTGWVLDPKERWDATRSKGRLSAHVWVHAGGDATRATPRALRALFRQLQRMADRCLDTAPR